MSIKTPLMGEYAFSLMEFVGLMTIHVIFILKYSNVNPIHLSKCEAYPFGLKTYVWFLSYGVIPLIVFFLVLLKS